MEKRTRPYEVMVRIGANAVETAHVIDLEEIVEDGKVTFAREIGPRPLALASPEFASIVKLIDRTTLAERDALAASHEALTEEHRGVCHEHDRLNGALATAREEIATHLASLADARARMAEVEQISAMYQMRLKEEIDARERATQRAKLREQMRRETNGGV